MIAYLDDALAPSLLRLLHHYRGVSLQRCIIRPLANLPFSKLW